MNSLTVTFLVSLLFAMPNFIPQQTAAETMQQAKTQAKRATETRPQTEAQSVTAKPAKRAPSKNGKQPNAKPKAKQTVAKGKQLTARRKIISAKRRDARAGQRRAARLPKCRSLAKAHITTVKSSVLARSKEVWRSAGLQAKRSLSLGGARTGVVTPPLPVSHR